MRWHALTLASVLLIAADAKDDAVKEAKAKLKGAWDVDSGVAPERAAVIADGSLQRGDAIRIIKKLLDRKVINIQFDVRNEVAHGKAFGAPQDTFIKPLSSQFARIEAWVKGVLGKESPSSFNYKELDRWLLSMLHWVAWVDNWWEKTRPKLLPQR